VTRWLLTVTLAAVLPYVAAAQQRSSGVDSIEQLFGRPPDDSRIMMRWWWFGPSVTRDELAAEMRAMKKGGIGGFEIATVYPMAVDDEARGIRNYPYLSPEFLDRIGFVARTARELPLRMDVTLGSGWSFGGPYITPSLAATRLRSDRREIAPAVTSAARPVPYDHERLIAAFVGRGATREVDPTSFHELDASGEGPIAIPPGPGPRTLLFYFAGPTGQVVKRAALGAEGYVLDHYNRAAIDTHLREAGDKLVAAAGPGGIHAVFCDSLEVYEADWTGDMLEEFRRRRGYDLRPLLPFLDYDVGERSRAVRRDLGQTQTDLYTERFLVPMREWARRNQVLFRIQNYGAPPASLASHRQVDLIDGEGFEWRTLSRTRWASSASHLFGKPVTSSETWTWIHSPAFRATPLDLKAEADLHFLAGVNQLIGHGWPYTPPQAGSPGWPFYAAGVFSDANPWWPVMADLAAYLHRVSFVLRQGDHVADVALYAPTADARAAMRPGQGDYLNLHLGIRDRIGSGVVPAILNAGYSFDLIDDETLAEATARRYRIVIVPGAPWMPEATKQWLAEFARGGGQVLAVPPDALAAQMTRALPPDVVVIPPTPEIGFVHRRLADAEIYFLANTSNAGRDVKVRLRDATPHADSWDPMTGAIARLDGAAGNLHLNLAPYASTIVVFRRRPAAAPSLHPRSIVASEEIRSGWSVQVGTRNPETARLPHSWAADPKTQYFSGTASYRNTLQLPASFRVPGLRVYMDFGEATPSEREPLPGGTIRGNSFAALVNPPIREAATLFVNGRRAGSVWAPPYRVDMTPFLRDGSNEIRIDVYNTAINSLAEGGRLADVAPLVERYGQRFRLQDLDGLKPLPSGLSSVPRLVAEKQ
jgi:hypothetical protein